MKKQILFFLMMFYASYQLCYSQTGDPNPDNKIQAGWGDLNYAVPESPAFKILGTSPSNIMRPTTTRDIAFSVGNYLVSNGGTIPQNLAVEISPALLNPNMSLADFKKKRFWYTSAFSLGTKVNADKSYAIGIGYKIRLWDRQDLRTNDLLKSKLNEFGRLDNDAYTKAIKEVAHDLAAENNNKHDVHYYLLFADSALNDSTNLFHKSIQKKVNEIISRTFDVTRISKLRDSIKKISWNKPISDLGFAALFNSKDSLLKNIKPFSKLGLWGTLGIPLFGQNGQLLVGVTGQIRDTLNSRLGLKTLNLGSRAYYGSNNLKGFVEVNTLLATRQDNTYKASIGIETTFFGGLWLDFSIGLTKQGAGSTVFTPGFNVFFANGEKKKPGV